MKHLRVSINEILCPTDFSDFSEHAMSRTMSLAKWFHARVTAVHVIPLMSPGVLMPGPIGGNDIALPEDMLRERRDDVLKELGEMAKRHATPGVKIDTAILDGHPWQEIVKFARTLPASLVIMGTHGRSGWERFLMGSTTEKVMRALPCPVLTMGRADALTDGPVFRRILCAVDLTPESTSTMEMALSLAEEYLADVTLLHAIDRGRIEWSPKDSHSRTSAEFIDTAVQAAKEQLERMSEGPHPYKVSGRVETDSAWRATIRVAKEMNADLIVVGAHGAGTLGDAFLGSTVNQVVRHAACPVFIARPIRDPGPESALSTAPSPRIHRPAGANPEAQARAE